MEQIIKLKHMWRTTEEHPSPRVLLKKTEQVCHMKNAHSVFNLILVEKYIDDQLVNSYSWTQSIDEDEYNEFLIQAEENKKNYKPKRIKRTPDEKAEKRKQYYKEYYILHKASRKEYYKENDDKLKEYRKQYYKENREKILNRVKQRQKQLWEEKQKNNNS